MDLRLQASPASGSYLRMAVLALLCAHGATAALLDGKSHVRGRHQERYLRAAHAMLGVGEDKAKRRWAEAAGRFLALDNDGAAGVHETIYAKAEAPRACGKPCVAHCIAGQPRELPALPGLRKSILHRLFHKFSENPVIFGVFAASGVNASNPDIEEGAKGYVRTPVGAVSDEELRPSLEFLGVDRALILRENPGCEGGSCQKKDSLECDAKELNISKVYDKQSGHYSGEGCLMQMSRLNSCMVLVREYEADHKMAFDWVTRVRPDVYFVKPVQHVSVLSTTDSYFSPWAPCGFGGMDWFYAMPRAHADKVASFQSGISCKHYHQQAIQATCSECLGCECWLAAWMHAEGVAFKKLPWAEHIPTKFCGETECPDDWDDTALLR